MPRRIVLQPHLSVMELEQQYRQAREPVQRSHFLQILWLLAQGHNAQQVAQITGYTPVWIRQLAKRYNQEGPQALGDRRRHNPGGQFFLSPAQQERLKQAILSGPPAGGGVWNSRAVAAWISQETGRAVYPQRGWDYLRRLGFTPQVPRPRHAKADPEAQETFKKNSRPSDAAPSRATPRGGAGTVGL